MATVKTQNQKIFLETTESKEIVRKSALWGLIQWNVVVNTCKIKDDLIIYLRNDQEIDKIWLVFGFGVKQELVVKK